MGAHREIVLAQKGLQNAKHLHCFRRDAQLLVCFSERSVDIICVSFVPLAAWEGDLACKELYVDTAGQYADTQICKDLSDPSHQSDC